MAFRSRKWRHAAMFAVVVAGCATGPAPPLVHLSDMRVKDVRLFEQRYTLALRLENPNPEKLPVWGMAYRVLVNDVEVGSGTDRTRLTIPPYDEALVEVEVTSNLFSLLERVRAAAGRRGERFEVAIRGNVSVANAARPLPFAVRAQFGGGTR